MKKSIYLILIIVLVTICILLVTKTKNITYFNTSDSFNVKVMKAVNNLNDDNYLVSPYSIKLALKMLKDGANGNSYNEINSLIGNDTNFINQINKRISVANAIFVKEEYKNYIEYNFYNKLKKYDSDIIYDSFFTPDVINDWVNNKTFKMIPKILDSVDKDFVLGIGNALAIDVEWLDKFDCANTKKEEFIKSDNSKIDVSMMNKKYENNIEYFINDDISGVIIPYQTYDANGKENNEGITLEFVGILPSNGINNYIKNLNNNKILEIDKIKTKIDGQKELYLSLPKFKYDYEINGFIKLLKNLGIKEVFNKDKAELTGIISKNNMIKLNIDNIYVNEAIHKTHIDLNENGTKAAAVTYFGIVKSSAMLSPQKETIEIKFNKPFIYIIRDKNTKEIMFLGVVETPQKWNGKTCSNN